MTADLTYLAYSAILTWVMVLVAGMWRVHGWTPKGMLLAFGNREELPDASPAIARAERAARNMLENMVLFTAVVVAGHLGGVEQGTLDLGAQLFFFARLAYFPVYVAGIAYLRTALWTAGVVGMGMILVAMC